MHYRLIIKGKLNKKQEEYFETTKKILSALHDKSKPNKGKPQTWGKLKRRTRLPGATLSKHLRFLLKQGIVAGKVVVREDGIKTVYEHVESKSLDIIGKAPVSTEPAVRLYSPRSSRKGFTHYEFGHLKRTRPYTSGEKPAVKKRKSKNEKYFVPSQEILPRAEPKANPTKTKHARYILIDKTTVS